MSCYEVFSLKNFDGLLRANSLRFIVGIVFILNIDKLLGNSSLIVLEILILVILR